MAASKNKEQGLLPFEGEIVASQFGDKEIRKIFHGDDWYFSVVNVVAAITESSNPARYWSDLKRKLRKEGFGQLYENIVQLKMAAADGKAYVTDTGNIETLFRIVQSISSLRSPE